MKLSQKRQKFNNIYGNLTQNETLKELLFAQQLQIEKLELIRSNTSKLVWWLVAIPILMGIIFFMLSGSLLL